MLVKSTLLACNNIDRLHRPSNPYLLNPLAMGPSQLAQLKNALNSAGLNRKSVAKKTKKGGKKGGSQDVDRAKKSAKLDEIRSRFNKFDERETKLKHDVGGRKLKGVTGRPTATRQAGLEQVSSQVAISTNLPAPEDTAARAQQPRPPRYFP